MANRVCPWWLGPFLANPLRRFWHDPHTILGPLVTEGMLVLEPGCGMGFFSIELAHLVGPQGKVVAVDLQPKMLAGLRRRAQKAGLSERIETRLATAGGLMVDDLAGKFDFALAFAMVHELPDESRFFVEMHRALRPGRKLLVAEPKGHVTKSKFAEMVGIAERTGLKVVESPAIRSSRAALFARD